MNKEKRWLVIVVGVLTSMLLLFWYGGFRAAMGKAYENVAHKLYARGEYTEALFAYKRAGLLGFPHEREQAATLYHLGHYDKADRLLARKGLKPYSLVTHGVILMALGKTEEASKSLRSVMNIPSADAETKALAAHNLSLLLRDAGRTEEARKMSDTAIFWSKGDSSSWHGPQPLKPSWVRSWSE